VATSVVNVALSMKASAPPTEKDTSALKTVVATSLKVAEDTVKNFVIAVAAASRRLLESIHKSGGGGRALLGTTTVEWEVSFTVTADLDNQTEPTDFGTQVINERLFENLQSLCTLIHQPSFVHFNKF